MHVGLCSEPQNIWLDAGAWQPGISPNHDLWEASGPTLLEKPWSAGVRLTQNETRGFLNFKRKKEEKTVWEQRGKWTFVYTIA